MSTNNLSRIYDDLWLLFPEALHVVKASALDLEHRVAGLKVWWDKLDRCHNPNDVAALNIELRQYIAEHQEVSHA